MKLWLLDADILIDFLSLDILDKLVKIHEIHAASSVIEEVQYFKRDGKRYSVSFREKYINTCLIKELSATTDDAAVLLNRLSQPNPFNIHPGEIESLAILLRESSLTFCTCDAAAIRTLPLLDLAECGISADALLRKSGLFKPGLKERLTENFLDPQDGSDPETDSATGRASVHRKESPRSDHQRQDAAVLFPDGRRKQALLAADLPSELNL